MDRTIVLPLLLALGATGCVRYHTAMYGAGRAVKVEDWDRALARYERALEARPGSERAADRYAHVRDEAVADGLAAAEAALEEGAYEVVLERLAYVTGLDPDVPEVLDLRKDAEDALVAAVVAEWKARRPREAYEQAVRCRKLFPHAPALDEIFETIRGFWLDAAVARLDEHRYEDALAAVAVVEELEPDVSELFAPVEERIRSAWADALTARARKEARWRFDGAAYLLYAQAWEVAGRPDDQARARALAEALAERGRFTVALHVEGSSRSRARAAREALKTAVAAVPEGATVSERPDLHLYVATPAGRCTEAVERVERSRDYVSGQIDVPNPEHVRRTEALANELEAREAVAEELEGLAAQLEAAEAEVAELDTQLAAAEQAATTAARQEEDARAQSEAATERRDVLADDLQRARRDGGDVAALEEDLGRIAGIILEWQEALLTAQDARRSAEEAAEALRHRRQGPADRLAALRRTHDERLATVKAHDSTRGRLELELRATPPTVPEDVHATHTYDEETWTRTCVATTFVSVRPRWDSALGGDERLTPSRSTTDTAHAAHPASGLEADPKAYPVADEALLAEAEAEGLAALAENVTALAEDHYRAEVQVALEELVADPRRGATRALALYLGAPERLDEGQWTEMQAHLQSLGIEDVDRVLGEVASR